MIEVKCTSVHLELLHELLNIDWNSIAPIIICWHTVCIILLLLLPELVIHTDVAMSASGKHSYLLCFQNVFSWQTLSHQVSEIWFPLFYSEQLVDTYLCFIPKSIWCPLLQACSGTLVFCQPRLPLIIPLIVEGLAAVHYCLQGELFWYHSKHILLTIHDITIQHHHINSSSLPQHLQESFWFSLPSFDCFLLCLFYR